MLTFTRWKQIIIIGICALGFLIVLPNFVSRSSLDKWPRFVPKQQLSLGLDLRGGAHLLLALEVNDVRKDWMEALRDDARKRLRDVKVGVSSVGIAGNSVQVRIAKPEEADAALKALRLMVQPLGNPIFGTSGPDIDVQKGEGGILTVTPTEPGLRQRTINAVSAAIETVRRRVDAMGTTASMKSGYIVLHSQACMPPMDCPSTKRSRSRPRCSVIKRYCARTISS